MRCFILPAAVLASAIAAGFDAPARAQAQPRASAETCVDVRVGDAQYYDCLNRQFEHDMVPRRRLSIGEGTLGNDSAPQTTGQFNESATREQMGNAFGKSATPQRLAPPAPPPVLGRH